MTIIDLYSIISPKSKSWFPYQLKHEIPRRDQGTEFHNKSSPINETSGEISFMTGTFRNQGEESEE